MMYCPNNKAGAKVSKCIPFKGSHTFAKYYGDNYAVFSYGEHFPLFAKIGGEWFGNSDGYSKTTAKHKTQLKPIGEIITYLKTDDLIEKIGINKDRGLGGLMKMASMVALMGGVIETEQEKQNQWKKRFLNLIPGFTFPDDFDQLTEAEKQSRLDKVIEVCRDPK